MSAMRHWKVLWNKRASDQGTELLLSDLSTRTDPVDTEPTKSPLARRKTLSGWRFSVILYILLGFSIFSLNLGVTVWASTGFPVVKGLATVCEGSCLKTKNSLTWLHLTINVLSTLLLSASNFCMQILCAPTREEVDAAHARRKWLSIGVPSLKNLFYVDRKKSALWILLGLSSIPLHLLWNSAVTNTLSSNDYIYNAVTEVFVSGAPWNTKTAMTQYPDVAQSILEKLGNHSLVSMSVTDCIKAYGLTFNSEYGNLLLVYDFASAEVGNNSLLFQGINNGNSVGGAVGEGGGGDWMCGLGNAGGCDFGQLSRRNATHWNPWNGFDFGGWTHGSNGTQHSFYIGGNVKYCLAEKTDHPCRLGICPLILIIVLGCNAVKTICFVLTLCVGGSMFPLVTNGDAVESFLLRPDASLEGRCLVSKVDVKKSKLFWSKQQLPLQWRSSRRRWAAGATKACCALILIITIVVICVLSGLWIGGTAALVSGGFGKPSTTALVGEGAFGVQRSPAAASLLANTPQILVSYIYLAYNALFTYMLTTAEWVGYSVHRQSLQVAWPKGHQRARGFLQLPYTYGILIMAASTLLHWLISQSLFLVRITIFDYHGTEVPGSLISSTGFSPYAIVFALSMGGTMLVAALLLGFLRTYPATMPPAACCSASIAALCQPREDMAKEKLTLEKLQWGMVDQGLTANGHDEVGHACFSAKEVTPLITGRTYA